MKVCGTPLHAALAAVLFCSAGMAETCPPAARMVTAFPGVASIGLPTARAVPTASEIGEIGSLTVWSLAYTSVIPPGFSVSPSSARLAPVEARVGSYLIQSWPLDEGTTAVLIEDHRVPLVRLQIVFPVGSWSPFARRAHAEEAFEIQNQDPAGALRARADRLSAGLSVSVGDRTSTLYASCLKEDLPKVLALARDVLTNRDFDRHELARRDKGRQISWAGSQKEPFFRAAQAAARGLLAASDPRRREWEKPEPLETDAARLAEARDTLIRLPGRTIAFAGDLTREEVERAAAGLLPPVLTNSTPDLEPKFDPLVPVEHRQKETTVPLPRLTQVYFGYGRDSLTYNDPDYPAFLVADHVLGGHFYSRLYVALRHEGGETYGAGTRSYGDVMAGPYGLGTFTRAPNATVTEQKLREVLRVFHTQGITEKERNDAVDYLKGQRPFQRQSPDQVLGTFLYEKSLGLPPGFLDDTVERASRVPLEEINRFITRYYDPSVYSMIRVVPR